MSPTVWTERELPATMGTMTILMGPWMPQEIAVAVSAWTERTAVATTYTERTAAAPNAIERTVPVTTWTERSIP